MSGAGSKNIELLLQHIPDFNNVVFFIEFDAAGNPVFVEEVGFVPNLVKNFAIQVCGRSFIEPEVCRKFVSERMLCHRFITSKAALKFEVVTE